ncbi:MAG: AAA family ATPase [Prevotella sp.]|nr:AAA family ATPase [Prevotella sp.]
MISPILALQQQRHLLELEYKADKEAFRRQTDEMGLRRIVKRGDAWFPLRVARSYYNSLNQLAVEVFRTEDTDIEHNFEFGRPVVFFTAVDGGQGGGVKIRHGITGTVSFVDGDRMVVTVPDGSSVIDLQTSGTTGVQLSFDETSYRTMFAALDRAIKGKGRLGYLRDLFYSSQKAETLTFAPMHFPYLNPTQEQAVNTVLRAKDVAIVHGPPGTGKTTTLVEAIYETLRRESQVLVCAQSNMAVDWISEKLVDRGVSVLRIGNPTKVNDKMLSFTYERRFEAHPDYPQLWAVRKAIRELRSGRRRGDEGRRQKIESLKSRAAEIEIRINAELFGEAKVIACTLVGSASRLLDGMKFSTLFIDEAAQALEAACWIPIRRVSRVVLAGDHCQLPPTVKSVEAMRGGLGKTLMERIVGQKPEVVTLLRMQYRMNEDIMRFPSEWFYGGMVESAPDVKYRGILDLDIPIEWVDTSGNEERRMKSEESGNEERRVKNEELAGAVSPAGSDSVSPAVANSSFFTLHSSLTSPAVANSSLSPLQSSFKESFVGESFGRINKAEAELTLRILEDYFMRIGRQRIADERIDVGIISPYRAQVQYLRRRLAHSDFFKPFRRSISVNTVDGFQGQERDVILISLVRSNDEGQIGFLRDLRRMNVAITRARMKLIIVGDSQTMTRHPFYRKLWSYVESLKHRPDA